jgi:hypothetical protein
MHELAELVERMDRHRVLVADEHAERVVGDPDGVTELDVWDQIAARALLDQPVRSLGDQLVDVDLALLEATVQVVEGDETGDLRSVELAGSPSDRPMPPTSGDSGSGEL